MKILYYIMGALIIAGIAYYWYISKNNAQAAAAPTIADEFAGIKIPISSLKKIPVPGLHTVNISKL